MGRKRRQTAQAGYEVLIDAQHRGLDLSSVDDMSGHDFERYVAKLLVNEGYSDVTVTQESRDFGVDIVAKHGDDWYAIQVKRHSSNVSRHAISDAVAGLKHYGCSEAMVVTNSHFSKSAIEFASSVGRELVDRDVLSDWIARFQSFSWLPASAQNRWLHASRSRG